MPFQINDSSVWRAFEDHELTHSAAHYLTSIMHLRKEMGYARITDVAGYLKVSRGAASRAIALLKERGWIDEDPNRMLQLSEEGLEKARTVERNYVVAEFFLEAILGVPTDVAREDACKMEHLLNPQTTQSLLKLIQVLYKNPEMLDRLKERLQDAALDCEHLDICSLCADHGKCLVEETRTENDS